MKFGDLLTLDREQFIARAPANALWFFVHIPKTAGSSLSDEMGRSLAPYVNIDVDYTRTDLPFRFLMRDRVHEMIATGAVEGLRSMSGHVLFPQYPRLAAEPHNVRMMTFLRDPTARVISDYRYQRTEMHPPYLEFRKEFPTLGSYVEHPRSQNTMAQFLGGHRTSYAEVLHRLNHDFAFVGLVEMYDFCFETFFAMAGKPGLSPGKRLRQTPDTDETEVEVTPELLRRIQDLNHLDMALYHHVHAVLTPHHAAWKKARERDATTGAEVTPS